MKTMRARTAPPLPFPPLPSFCVGPFLFLSLLAIFINAFPPSHSAGASALPRAVIVLQRVALFCLLHCSSPCFDFSISISHSCQQSRLHTHTVPLLPHPMPCPSLSPCCCCCYTEKNDCSPPPPGAVIISTFFFLSLALFCFQLFVPCNQHPRQGASQAMKHTGRAKTEQRDPPTVIHFCCLLSLITQREPRKSSNCERLRR